MGSLLVILSVVDHDNPVRIFNSRKTVRNDERGTALQQAFDSLLHLNFCLCVDAGRRLVENQNPRIRHHRSGKGEKLARVRKLFREDMNDYKARGETIRNAELFRGQFAISECPSDYVDSPTVVGAQAANELLNIVGVKASFVLTEYKGVIYISARAIDEVNVQIIMERMGGGGHLNMAGCQLETVNMEGARNLLKSTLTEMQDGGEI